MINIAERIIEKFGGLTPLAKALGHKNISTVQGWKERGIIPALQQPNVMSAGKQMNIPIHPADFFEEF